LIIKNLSNTLANRNQEMNTTRNNSLPDSDHYVIAIGASAGGLEAIHEFFDNMPSNGNFSFVIIQHLSPDYKSLLVELVSKHTNMKVVEAQHDILVEKDYVYVIPNNKLLTIEHHRLRLSEKNFEKAPNTAIDTFLHSLANDQGSKAIAIILGIEIIFIEVIFINVSFFTNFAD